MQQTLFLLVSALLAADACPGSSAWGHHAKCSMKVTFSAPCSDVEDEINARVKGENGWYDPHNKGTYGVVKAKHGAMTLKRVTGNKRFTDLMDFTFHSTSDGGCSVEACSESQVTSYKDFSTNYCNLHDLYCGAAVGCNVVEYDLSFTEFLNDCGEHQASTCRAVLDFSADSAAVASTRINSSGSEGEVVPKVGMNLLHSIEEMLALSDTDCTDLYRLDDGMCGDICLSKKLAPYAIKFGPGLKEGNCKSQGYTVYDHDASINAGPLGKLKVTIYKKPAAVLRLVKEMFALSDVDCTDLYRLDDGMCGDLAYPRSSRPMQPSLDRG